MRTANIRQTKCRIQRPFGNGEIMVKKISILACLYSLVAILLAAPANADHIYNTYPQRGYVFWASYDDNAFNYVVSDRCNDRELEAYEKVRASTVGYFNTRWPSGVRMARQNCTGSVNNSTDIRLSYEPYTNFPNGTADGYGGYNESILAPASWCAIWGASHPCGSHPSVVHLNVRKFTSASYSVAYRQRLIMHETGHSFGLAHHCTGNSIMNDGNANCNGGAWTSVMSYQLTDHEGLRNLYPNWKYPL